MKNKSLFFKFAFKLFAFTSLIVLSPELLQAEEAGQIEQYSFELLLKSTQSNHPDLLKLQEEYKRSLLDVKDSYASLGPSVDLQASGTYMLNPPLDAIYINADDLIASLQPGGLSSSAKGQRIKVFDGMENTLYNFELSLMQPLFTWGKITNSIKLYKEISQIKQTQLTQQSQQLETELKTRLISLYYLGRILELLNEEQTFTDRLVEVTENAEKSGMLLHQDLVEAKIQAKELEIAKQDLLEQMNNQLLELRRTSGIQTLSLENINYDFVASLMSSIGSLLQRDVKEVEEEVLSGNQSSIKMLTQLEMVSKSAEKIARGYENWKPDLALQMSSSYSGSRFPLLEPNWLRKDDYSVNISLGIKTTIWDGGKKIRDVSRKISERETAEINKLDARSTISKTFNSQWNAAQVCTMKIEYQELKIESASSKIEQKEQMYQSGYGSESDVLSAKIERCNAQIEKEQQTLERAVACLTIMYLQK